MAATEQIHCRAGALNARIQDSYETLVGEGLKTAAEVSLHLLGGAALGRACLEHYSGGLGGRITDPRLYTNVAGVTFENPLIVGAGWDKKGRAIHGLYSLGFGSVEVGTVLPFPQPGNPRPRLWTIGGEHRVGLNSLSFNSPGDEIVEGNLNAAQPLPCKIGLSVGRNKVTPNEMASEAHARVIKKLGHYADYIVLGISSPNTPDLRGLQDKALFCELIQSALEAMPSPVPLFVKIDAERSDAELHDMIEVGLDEGLAGFVAVNTYMGSDLKAHYGERWARTPGGLSGADPRYRALANKTIKRIYEEAGDLLAIIGVGGVEDAATALEKIRCGASAVQIVTAMRPSWGRVAAKTNQGLIKHLDNDSASSIREYIGLDTVRGQLVASGSY